MNKILPVALAGLTIIGWTIPVAGQNTRETIIEEARSEINDSVAIGIYLSALDPSVGEPDSLWAVAAFEISDRLFLLDQQTMASLWLRWLARHGAQWPVDRDYYDPAVFEAFDLAVEFVGDTSETEEASTNWQWPREYVGGSQGSVRAYASGGQASVAVSVEGQEPSEGVDSLSLDPGTYEFVVSAEGHEPATVVREILPGVTTLLDVDLVPQFAPEVREWVEERMARITYNRAGVEVCRNGIISSPDGLILTSLSSVRDGASLRVSAFREQETFADVPLVTTDPETDLAVLQIATARRVDFPTALSATAGQSLWSVHFQGCGSLTVARTQLEEWPVSAGSVGGVASPLSQDAVGSPLVDRGGSLLGLVTGPTTFVPIGLAEDLLAQARQELLQQARPEIPRQIPEEVIDQGSSGGSFPWKWVGAGVGAAGLAFALTQGGGDPGPGPVVEKTTGTIRITFPPSGG